ncbi:dihydropteroate synthase [Costertonia aggregata]|uniref:Dihydropteroate synthase n=1 Tax=Costertonia aggregata TaxID=343403 RepID=A0A7H9ARW5_9FLAO|nr:dihydropteroate synthase [Costertonia aggregata]QLG46203.1 dihydropteroate synthase [Costertonia aggregata]
MTLNCKGVLINVSSPKIMGVLNLTPDSFYDGGKYKHVDDVLNQVDNMLNLGATFIDIGAYSSRPGAQNVSEEEELNRILPILEILMGKFPEIIISVDTFRSSVAKKCLQNGAALINDISAGKLDANMMQVVAEFKVPYVMMHMRGNPETMQQQTDYDNVSKDILFYFSERIAQARSLGINDIIIDPGFGFAKTLEQNYELLRQLELFQNLELPLLVGVSRKSMIYKILKTDAENALNGTTALHMFALAKGAKILRVHDVKEAMECVTLFNALR